MENCAIHQHLRKIELEAYSQVVDAFRAQGELSWRKEVTLSELRIALRIPPDRHAAEMRRALLDAKLRAIAAHHLESPTHSMGVLDEIIENEEAAVGVDTEDDAPASPPPSPPKRSTAGRRGRRKSVSSASKRGGRAKGGRGGRSGRSATKKRGRRASVSKRTSRWKKEPVEEQEKEEVEEIIQVTRYGRQRKVPVRTGQAIPPPKKRTREPAASEDIRAIPLHIDLSREMLPPMGLESDELLPEVMVEEEEQQEESRKRVRVEEVLDGGHATLEDLFLDMSEVKPLDIQPTEEVKESEEPEEPEEPEETKVQPMKVKDPIVEEDKVVNQIPPLAQLASLESTRMKLMPENESKRMHLITHGGDE